MDYLSPIRKPIEKELEDFISLFNDSLSHTDGMLETVLNHIRQRAGKRMRPMLILLMAKCFGEVNASTQHSAVGLELLHTASLVHDDVVDESGERRGQKSVNALYDNKVAVLVGDYILSTALLNVSQTGNNRIVSYLARLGQTLANGEILQLTSNGGENISEETYYDVIKQKTAALFEACCAIGAMSSGATEADVEAAAKFGQTLGIIFQIRDDIFDYYSNSEIGKPTGRDMAEGKLTLPVIYALNSTNDAAMLALADKVKKGEADRAEIEALIAFAKQNGGIEYAERKMQELRSQAYAAIASFKNEAVRKSLEQYIDFVIDRQK